MAPDDIKNPSVPDGPTPDAASGLASLAPVLFTPARSFEELQAAYAVVYRSYLDRGYISSSEPGLRFGFHNLLPETVTFVAVLRNMVIATVTLVSDSPLGLPMDEIYADELNVLRAQGQRLGEVTMLADRRREFVRTLPMVLALFRMLMDHAIQVEKLDQLCITLNPRHEDFYRQLLHFQPLGGEKTYPSVQGNPALAMRFPLGSLEQLLETDSRYRSMYRRTESINRASAEYRFKLPREAVRRLAERLPQREGLSATQLEYLRNI